MRWIKKRTKKIKFFAEKLIFQLSIFAMGKNDKKFVLIESVIKKAK